MAFSYVKYSGDNLAVNFVVSIDYLDQSHIHVYVNDVEQAFEWFSATTISLATAPVTGVLNIEIRRVTPRDVLMTTFTNGNILFAGDLNVSALQSLYVAQEYHEQATSAFPSGHTLDSHSDALPGNSVAKGTLRIYDANSKWADIAAPADGALLIGDTAQPEGARWLAKGTDGYTLEIEDAVAGKLSWKLGLRKLVTTAGDLLAATASGVLARLAIGANNAVLVVDTSVGTVKMAWKTTLAGLTLTSPVITGTVTGTYTLGGTPTISGTVLTGTQCVKNPVAVTTATAAAHGLGASPTFVVSYLECLTTEYGYAVGDRIYPTDVYTTSQGNGGWSVAINATNTTIYISSLPVVHHASTLVLSIITPANWKIVAVPYKVN